jgi:hypothetical protein
LDVEVDVAGPGQRNPDHAARGEQDDVGADLDPEAGVVPARVPQLLGEQLH